MVGARELPAFLLNLAMVIVGVVLAVMYKRVEAEHRRVDAPRGEALTARRRSELRSLNRCIERLRRAWRGFMC